jgi:uncharacterized protein
MSRGYKILIAVMSAVIIGQGIYILTHRPAAPVKQKPVKVTVAPKMRKPLPAAKGTIAIVIDDWGYNVSNVQAVQEIPYPLTMAILPNLPYSQKVAESLHSKGFEIILHCPMEPLQKMALEKNTILTNMDGETIKKIIDDNLRVLPYMRGISNHMGSRATEDNRTMQIIMSELKNKGLYFLDSFVTPRSVAESEAFRLGVSFVKRDIFLDNQSDQAYIKQQMSKLIARARSHGFAVGIGHDRKNTLEVLRQAMPEAAKEGYKFVYLSDLVK